MQVRLEGAGECWLGAHVVFIAQVYLPGHYAYRNYCDRDIVDFGHAYYGDNYSRLQQVKAAYDPRNVFRYQQAIQLQA